MVNLNKLLFGAIIGVVLILGSQRFNEYLMNKSEVSFYLEFDEILDLYGDKFSHWRSIVDESFPHAHFEITAADKYRYGDKSPDTIFYATLVWEFDQYGNERIEYTGRGDTPPQAIEDAICTVPIEVVFKPQ